MEKKLVRRSGAGLVSLGLMLGALGSFAPSAWAEHKDTHQPGGGGGGNNEDVVGGAGEDTESGGNNGTVKIRERGTDVEDVSNDPHIDCLEIAWYNFGLSAGATITLTQTNPTAGGAPQVYTYDVEDDAAGGGSDDNDGVYLPAFVPTGDAHNGYWHVDVLVVTTTAQGSQDKAKTIWLKNDCGDDTDPVETPGYLRVSKTVAGTGTPAASYGFTVSCTDTTATPSTFTLAPGTSQTVAVDHGGASCTVVESNTGGATSTTYSVNGGTATAGTSASVTVDGTEAAPDTVAFENTHTPAACTTCDTIIPVVVPVVTQTPVTPAPTPPAPEPVPVVAGVEIVAPPAPAAAPAPAPVPVPAPAAVPAAPKVLGTQLARTGIMTERLLQLAAALLVLGAVALVAGSRGEQRTVSTRRR